MTGEPTKTASKASSAPNYHLKSKVAFTIRCQLYSTHCQPARILRSINLKSNYAIKVASMKIQKIFHYKEEAIMRNHRINTFRCAKMNGVQRRALVSPRRMHYTYSSMSIGPKRCRTVQACSLSHCQVMLV